MAPVTPRLRLTLPAFASLLFVSCGVRSLQNDFVGYNKAYASMINEQMLLNLARLDNGHPPYFMTVGAIDAKYNYSSEISGNRSGTNTNSNTGTENSTVSGGVLGLASQAIGATSSAVANTVGGVKLAQTESPNFKIIPLNDAEVSQQVLKPIPTDVFYTLYQQGYPIDLLLRIMVERIETSLPGEKGLVMQNSPVRGTAQSYARFLRACAILREMQRRGVLEFTAEERFFPISSQLPKAERTRSGAAAEAPAGDPADGGPPLLPPLIDPDTGTPVDLPPPPPSAPSPEQILEAKKNGYEYSNENGIWQFGQRSRSPTFVLRDNADSGLSAGWRQAAALEGIDQDAISRVIQLLSDGIGVKTGVKDKSTVKTRLILRSYSRVLEAVAAEQRDFYTLLATGAFSIVPASQRIPIIRTRWDGTPEKLEKPLASVSYQGKTYSITDPQTPSGEFSSTRNRDAFRILVSLSSQVTVDIAKYQNQVLELR